MKKISFGFLYPLLTLIILVIALNRKIFMVPPLGSFLNPFKGAVQNERNCNIAMEMDFEQKEGIEIFFDERSVPHIFAEKEGNLFFAQGYVTASNRLWHMDFLSYVSAGRLSEIFGEDLLSYDRQQRRSGILSAAKISLKLMESNLETKRVLDSYTEGVNRYIHQLSQADLPLEYKLLDYQPEPWTNLKSVLILKYMGALLSGYEEDFSSTYLYTALGKKEYDKLFSNYFINKNKSQFSIEQVLDSSDSNCYIDFSFMETSSQISESSYNSKLGSNSWAIAPRKSESGSAILCNDPHLNLSLPAVWYEVQLISSDMNVYGYSIPGTPGVIIGYNKNISWGMTNGSVDVCDYFKLELKGDYSQYKFDKIWKNTQQTIEEIKVRNDDSFYDTVFYSVHGPIFSDYRFGEKDKAGYAVNWTLNDASNEFLTFIKLNKASNYLEFKEAIQHYKCPVQNFTYADIKGNIASHIQGKILKTNWFGRGKFILDGTKSSHLIKETLTHELPFVENPVEGFIYSANNNPFHKNDSLYVNGHYSELRADKIEQFLARPKKFSIENMRAMQTDNTGRLAELAVPILNKYLQEDNLNQTIKFYKWRFNYDADEETALLFERWWSLIRNNTWDELLRFRKVNKFPDDLILLDMIKNDPNNKYFDDISTDKVETAGDIVKKSMEDLNQSWLMLPMKWGDYNTINIRHLLEIPALSKTKIKCGGNPNAINALSGSWGPSLRFIVEMKEKPQGYGIYVGGQSGNPGSKEYDRFVNDWISSKYYKHNFYLVKEEWESSTGYKWTIK